MLGSRGSSFALASAPALVLGLGLASISGCSRSSAPAPDSPPTPAEPAAPEPEPPAHSEHGHAPAGPNPHHRGHGHHRHHRFENAEQWAEQFDDPSRDEWQRPESVIDFIAPAPDARVADVGAGTGYFSVRLARRIPQGTVFANDIEPDMVRYLTERAQREGLDNMVAIQGSAHDPSLPDDLDVVFMCDVVHHIDDPQEFFRTVVSRLQPEGRVVIVDFKKDAPEGVPGPPPAMRIAQVDLVADLAGAGLVLARVDRERLPYQYIVELRPAP